MLKVIKIVMTCVIGLMLMTIIMFFFFMFTHDSGLAALGSAARMYLCVRIFKIEAIIIIVLLLFVKILQLTSRK